MGRSGRWRRVQVGEGVGGGVRWGRHVGRGCK